MKLQIIIASTRPGRKGQAVGEWFTRHAKEQGKFEVEVIDLAEVNLPFMDEPNHPRLAQYTQEHTKAWSARIAAGDAFILVTPEYNFSFPATIKNALDYLYQEWNNKPVSFVSYGGVSGGTRGVQQLKQVTQALQMVAIADAVAIPFFTQHIDGRGYMAGNEKLDSSALNMLDQLFVWAERLQGIRNN